MTRSTRQNIVTSEPLRQNPVTPGTGTGTGTTADPGTGIRQISTGLFAAFEYPQGMLALPRPPQAAPATTPAAPAPSTPPVDPMTALTNALTAAGIDAKSLGLTLNEQQCYYPGGAYMNRQISATLPNGTVEKFDAGLVQANPRIAVTELARLMGLRVS